MADASGAESGERLRVLAVEKNVTREAMGGLGRDFSSANAAFFRRLETVDQSEAARARALAGREHVLARHSADRLVRDVDALYRELCAAKKAA